MTTATKEVSFDVTDIYRQNAVAWTGGKYRRALNEGGTSSSKTYSILQTLILIGQDAKDKFLISVVSESMPHLKRGAIRDFFNLLNQSEENNPCWNKTDKIYTWNPGDPKGQLEFFPADDPAKQRGARRKILFINECNNVYWEAFRELDIRTELFTFLDWNPVSEFWAHENLINNPENAYIHSTYLDAVKVLPKEVVDNIESNRERDPNWWNIYGLGLIGRIEGLVYPYFTQVDELPEGDKFYGLDFGFSQDPVGLGAHVIIGDNLYSDELIYETGLTNDAIGRKMDLLGVKRNYDEIWADAAEPKSIQELCDQGFNVKPSAKGPGSVEYGHQKVNQFKQFWTKRSLNAIKEQRNFRYIEDKAGKLTDKTTHAFSHMMDERRYAVSAHRESGGRPRTKKSGMRFGG